MPLFSEKSPTLRSCCFFVLAFLLLAASSMRAQSTTVVISQIYGGGGGTGATANYLYSQDYVELFNLGTTSVNIGGWSVQYMSSAGTSTSATNVLSIPTGTTLAPGAHYLLAGPTGSSASAPFSGAALPVTPDVTAAYGSFAIAGAGGKVFLVSDSTALANSCTGTDIVDYVGQGSASCYQGAGAAPAPTALSADVRTVQCTNTGSNVADFTVSTTAVPRNSASTATPCGVVAPTAPSVTVAVNPTSVVAGNSTLITAKVTKGTSTTISTVTVDLSAFGGSATQPLYDDGTHGDTTAGDLTYSFLLTVPTNQAANTYTLTAKVTDAGSLSGTGSATLTTTASALSTSPTVTNGTANPNPVTSGGTVLLTGKVTAGTNPTSTGLTLTADLSAFGGSTTQAFYDDGTHGDTTAGDGIYSYTLTVPSGQTPQSYTVNLTVKDSNVRSGTGTITFAVQAPIAAAATVVVQSSTSSAVVGSSITLTATVAGNKSSAPSGTPTFYDNGTSIGQGSTLSGGSSSLVTKTLTVGSHVITASYPGDSIYPSVAATSSTPTTVTITAAPVPDFSISASNTNIILNDDQKTGVVTIAVNFLNSFNSTVALSCSGLPAGSRCAFSPSSLSATGVSVMTVAVDGASLAPHSKPFGKGGETALAFSLLALPFALRRKVRARLGMVGTMLGLLLVGVAVISTTGCSGSTSTPASTSTITVTGTGGGVTHTTTFTLTAQ